MNKGCSPVWQERIQALQKCRTAKLIAMQEVLDCITELWDVYKSMQDELRQIEKQLTKADYQAERQVYDRQL